MTNSLSTANKTVGILSNPLSGRIKNNISVIRDLVKSIPGQIYREASKLSEFESVLEEFAESQLDLLVIIAGDGTVHAVLSYIFSKQIFSPLPMLAVIPGGTTNMTAKDFHVSGNPVKVLLRLALTLANPGPYPCITRPVLRIRNGDDVPQYGMFFGAGIITEGVKYSHKGIRGLGVTGERVSAVVLIRYLFSVLFGRCDNNSENTKIHIQDNDDAGRDEDCLLIFATCLDRLLLGLHPYWGKEREPLHVTLVRSSAKRLWISILALLSGRGEHLSEADGYRSHNLSSLRLTMNGDFIIDGEVYTADQKKGEVHISANDAISVIDLSA